MARRLRALLVALSASNRVRQVRHALTQLSSKADSKGPIVLRRVASYVLEATCSARSTEPSGSERAPGPPFPTDVLMPVEPDAMVTHFAHRGRRLIDWETFHLADRHEALRVALHDIGRATNLTPARGFHDPAD